jgi:hypothetical protein
LTAHLKTHDPDPANKIRRKNRITRKQKKRPSRKRGFCEICNEDKANLRFHMAVHTGIYPFTCPIDGCSLGFTKKERLASHIVKSHENGRKPKTRKKYEPITLE